METLRKEWWLEFEWIVEANESGKWIKDRDSDCLSSKYIIVTTLTVHDHPPHHHRQHQHMSTTITNTATKKTTRASRLLNAFCGPERVLSVYLFNPHRNLMLSLKIRKRKLSEFQKIFEGNTVKCRVMLLIIICGYYGKDKAMTKRKLGQSYRTK